MLLQALSIVFALFMIYWVRLHFRRQHFEFLEYILWVTLWILFIYLALFPQTVRGLAETLNITRVFDLFVILAFIIVTFITFQNRIFAKRLEKKLENVVREKAIKEITKQAKK